MTSFLKCFLTPKSMALHLAVWIFLIPSAAHLETDGQMKKGYGNFRFDEVHQLPVIEKRVVLKDGPKSALKEDPSISKLEYEGQKLFIKFTNGRGKLLYNGIPVETGDKFPITHLKFSPDNKVAVALGGGGSVEWRTDKRMYFIHTDTGVIYKTVDLGHWGQATAQTFEDGIVILYSVSKAVSNALPIIYLSCHDYSGKLIWKRELDGVLSSTDKRLAVSLDGQYIISSLFERDSIGDGTTYLLNAKGRILNKFDNVYDPLFLDDSCTAVLTSRKEFLAVNVMKKTVLFESKINDGANSRFALIAGDIKSRAYIYKSLRYSAHNWIVNEVIGIGARDLIVWKFNSVSADYLNVFNSKMEKRIILKPHVKKWCKSLDLENY